MSIGIGGWASITYEDEKTVKYNYGTFNWNDKAHNNDEKIMDGEFIIDKTAIINDELYKMLDNDIIEVRNCSNCWHETKTDSGKNIDFMAMRIIFKIFNIYNETQKFPEKVSYCV